MIIVIATFILLKFESCGHEFDVTTSARMGTGLMSNDTTKPKSVNHHWTLTGSDTLFQLLWIQINSPIDVTPRQTEQIKQWLQSSIKQDSTVK
jgi:hypothetical protein